MIRQHADLLYVRKRVGAFVKLGWSLGPQGSNHRDETWFDADFPEVGPPDIGFVYARPGHTAHHAAPRMPPYVCVEPGRRLCLDRQGLRPEALDTSNAQAVRSLRNYLRVILYCYGRQVRPTHGTCLAERVDALMGDLAVSGCLGPSVASDSRA